MLYLLSVVVYVILVSCCCLCDTRELMLFNYVFLFVFIYKICFYNCLYVCVGRVELNFADQVIQTHVVLALYAKVAKYLFE